MEQVDNYHKYIKYKNKYINLLEQYGGKKYNYYFIHSTKDSSSIKSILKSGALYAGKYLLPKQRALGGDEALDNVYANIYFEDLKNLSHMWDYAILLDPKIFMERETAFVRGWRGKDIKLTNDIDANIRKIRKFIKNPIGIPKRVAEAPGILHHEVLFKDKIILDGNILGIMCNSCSKKDLQEFRDIIKTKPYSNIKIYTKNYPFPTLAELKK